MKITQTKTCYILLIAIILGISLFYVLKLENMLTLDSIQKHSSFLLDLCSKRPFFTGILFTLLYSLITLLCLPFHILFMLLAGYLFFYPLAIIYSILGSTVGGTCLFFIVRSSVGQFVQKKLCQRFSFFSNEISKHAANYLLFLRIVRFLPITVINLLPAFFSVSIQTYIWTSIIGSIPAAIVYCHTGETLNHYFDPNHPLVLSDIVGIKLQYALTVVGFISLFPIGVKHLIKIIKKMRKS